MNFKKIKITTDYITLGQVLKFVNLIDFGGEAKNYINSHEIFVNDELCKARGKKLYPGTKIIIDNSMFFEIIK